VLVVDDEPSMLEVLKRTLRDRFEVLAASSGAEALRLCAGQRLDVILSDFAMPGQDGLSLIRALRLTGQAAPAVLVTAIVGHWEIDLALSSGLVARVIGKPWFPEALVDEVQALLVAPRRAAHG
jgi:CheY-like chemotaxis protein